MMINTRAADEMGGDEFTPGPWSTDYLDKHGQRVVSGEHIEICTCWHHSVGAIEKEMEANARLIAAAPDLFDACASVWARLADTGDPTLKDIADECRAAIRKATGK